MRKQPIYFNGEDMFRIIAETNGPEYNPDITEKTLVLNQKTRNFFPAFCCTLLSSSSFATIFIGLRPN